MGFFKSFVISAGLTGGVSYLAAKGATKAVIRASRGVNNTYDESQVVQEELPVDIIETEEEIDYSEYMHTTQYGVEDSSLIRKRF